MRPGWVKTAAARQAEADLRAAELRFLNSPLYLWDKVLTGGKHAEYLAQPLKETAQMNKLGELRDTVRTHFAKYRALEAAARRWRPDPRNPGKSLDGSDLDSHPAEHRVRKLKEAQAAITALDAEGIRVLNPLIDAAEREPRDRLQLGTRLGAAETGEVSLLVQQYRDLTKAQQAELQTLGMAALTRGDLTAALQHKRAAEVLHVNTPDLDTSLMEADPVRKEATAQLDHLRRVVEAAHAEQARVHVRAGIGTGTEQVSHIDWAAEHGLDPEGDMSFVEAALGAG